MEKLPPIEKIYEAWSAILEGRVELDERGGKGCRNPAAENWKTEQGAAYVLSSDGSKAYRVTWKGEVYASNDAASYWQGYAGYPLLAVFMLQGKLPFDASVAIHFKDVPWKELNLSHRANYMQAVNEVLEKLERQKVDITAIRREADRVYQQLRQLPVRCVRSSSPPPSSKRKSR